MRRTAFLDAFRAFAAFYVLLGHCLAWGGRPSPVPAGLAVDLFMVISGFLMIYTVDHARERDWVRRFYIRRFFRIAPAYYVILLLVFLLSEPMREGLTAFQAAHPEIWTGKPYGPDNYRDFSALNMGLHISFLFGLIPQYADSTMLPDWSLSLEMQFYAAFPLLYLAARRMRFLPIAIALTALCVAATSISYRLWSYPEPSPLWFKLPVFLVGMLIHEAKAKGPIHAVLGIAILSVLVLHSTGLAAVPLIVLVAWLAKCWLIGSKQPPRWVSFASDCSYSVYLIHIPVLFLLGPLVPGGIVPMSLVVIIVSYGLSWLSFLAIEKPGIRLGKLVAGSRRPIAAPMT